MQNFTEQQLDALEQVSGMISGVMMEMDDPTGVGGVECDLLDQIYQRLQDLEKLCDRTVADYRKD